MKGIAIHVLRIATVCGAFSITAHTTQALSTGETSDGTVHAVVSTGGALVLRQSTALPGADGIAAAIPKPGTPPNNVTRPPVTPPAESPPIPSPKPATPVATLPTEIDNSTLNERLAVIERLLERSREQDRSMMMMMIKITLIVSGVTGLTGIGAVIAVVILQARWINRVSEASLLQSQPPPSAALDWGRHGLPEPASTSPAIQASRQQFSDAIQSLRSQIEAMERGTDQEIAPSSGPHIAKTVTYQPEDTSLDQREFEIVRFLEKGTQLLDIGRADRALVCFDQARNLAPDRAEVHLKRARTLEQLQRENEALEAFDQVLQIDPTMVAANLGKAGILNRLERYNEALECYEKALGQAGVPKRPVV